MSFTEVIAELPRLTFEQRQILIREALELDDPPLSSADEALIDRRLSGHHADPDSSISLEDLKASIRSRPK
jgi:putative addiction module component (TIGR02574 family)